MRTLKNALALTSLIIYFALKINKIYNLVCKQQQSKTLPFDIPDTYTFSLCSEETAFPVKTERKTDIPTE